MTYRQEYEQNVRASIERLDVLEDTLPSGQCQAAGCTKPVRYEWCGEWGLFWLCSEHRRLYATHDRIVSKVRNLHPERYTQRVAEWYCRDCWRWVNGLCCPGCLRIDPANVRWMSDAEIREAREKALRGR